ncbi:hypothetical protein PMZ80_010498 [Knufia obscura]|uniref:Alpha/beta hydrolase fold-3 domain-containing protein n=2 Tax=Knufia TaxID=430999 RepID=A0AAN8I5A2_9EURO|nr:hypothetical protein PMZ80_010498 [Knufia obscura]KAK5950151.1 hypothetical protein OHC33_008866 [Knufia fluminis]
MSSTLQPPIQPQSAYKYHPPTSNVGGTASGAARPNNNLFRHNTTSYNHFLSSANAQQAPIAMAVHPQQQQAQQPPQKNPRNPLHPSIIDRLDPAFVKLYNSYIAPGPTPSNDINIVRSNFSALYSYATAPATGVGGIGETSVPGWQKYPGDITVRVYVPPGEEPGTRKVWPVHFNFHGGGWAVGDLETSAHICHHICASAPCCVIDVEYRLIPEYPFPIGIMDGLSAVAHILVNHKTFSIDPHNITFGGESSGATIALVLSHMFRDAGSSFASRVKGVVVGTPSISDIRKYNTPEESPWESMRESEHAPLLDWKKLKWFDTFKWMSLTPQQPNQQAQAQIDRNRDAGSPSPTSQSHSRRPSYREMMRDVSWYSNLLSAPNLKDLAPLTWIGTAEVDPLRDEAEAYAETLREHGNNVVTKRYPGVPHPFMHMDGVLVQGREYVSDVILQIRACLYPTNQDASKAKEEKKDGDVMTE